MQYQMEKPMRFTLIFYSIIFTLTGFSQQTKLTDAISKCKKGEYVIMEVRMQLEDEFQTIEGNEAANLSRVAIFTGKNKNNELLSRGFSGYNQVVQYLNQIENFGFVLNQTYSIKGNSLLITHYVFRKQKR